MMAMQHSSMVLMLFPSCVYLIMLCDFVTESHDVFPCSILVVKSRIEKLKEKEKEKENRNNLDVLPSHDMDKE